MPVAQDLSVTEKQAKAGIEAGEILESRLQESVSDDEEFGLTFEGELPEREPVAPKEEVPLAPPSDEADDAEPARLPRLGVLEKKAREIAASEEKRIGTPAKITEDRLLDKPGWKEREIAFLAKKTDTPAKKVKELKDEGGDEAQGLQIARSFLVTEEKRQRKARQRAEEEKTEASLSKARKRIAEAKRLGISVKELQRRELAGEKTITVGKVSGKPQKIIDTPEIRQLKKDNPKLFNILERQGIDAFNKAISAEKFTEQKAIKRFNKLNTELPDGQFISKKDLAKIKEEAPEVHSALVTKGFDEARKVNTRRVETVKEKAIFRFPVLMSKPETIATDITTAMAPLPKGDFEKNPGKFFLNFFAERFKRQTKPEEQADLKAAFESQEAQPLWLKMLGGGGSLIIKKPDGEFTRVLAMDFPIAPGGKPGRIPLPRILRVGKSVRTVAPKDVGMGEAQFARFVKARVLNSKLDPTDFKNQEARAFEKMFESLTKQAKRDPLKPPTRPSVPSKKDFREASTNLDKWLKAQEGKTLKNIDAAEIVRQARANEAKILALVKQAAKNRPPIGFVVLPTGQVSAVNRLELKDLTEINLTTAQAAGTKPLTKVQSETLAKISGLTKPQIKELQATNTLVQLLPSVSPAEATKILTEAEPSVKTEVVTKLVVQSQPATKTLPVPKVAPKVTPKAPPKVTPKVGPETVPTKFIVPKPVLPKSFNRQDDNKKRRDIQRAKGAIAWRQGQLHGKDRWDVVTSPFTKEENFVIVLGRKPVGAILAKGPGSAKKTAQLIFGPRLKEATLVNQPGIFSTLLEPTGTKKIKLTFEKDVEITKKVGSLEEKGRVFPLP